MAKKQSRRSDAGGPFARAAAKVRRMLRIGRTAKDQPLAAAGRTDLEQPIHSAAETAGSRGRATRRPSDIPLDQIANEYVPPQTSLKGSFRTDGSDRQRDQEYAGVDDDRWADEDRLTNRSGDPRIGTHGRSYEAAERNRSRNND